MSAYYAIVLLILFVVAFTAALAFYIQVTSLRSRDDERRKTADDAVSLNQKAQKELESARDELGRRRTEAAELREKLNDMRSRQHKQRETDRKTKGSAEADLTEQLNTLQNQISGEQSRYDVLSREASGMQEELKRLRDGHKKLEETLKTAQAAPAKVAPAAALVAETPRAPVAPPPPKDDELLRRVEGLDRQLRDVRKKAGEQDEELKRARSKSSTATRMQLLTKNELDLFKEKMVWSEKRVVELERLLFENKVTLPERELAPQPKAPQLAPGILARESANTGGEGVVTVSADYVPEGPASETTPEAMPAPAAAGESAPAVESAPPVLPPPEASSVLSTDGAGDTEGRIDAVPPIRRPRSVVETRVDEVAAKAE